MSLTIQSDLPTEDKRGKKLYEKNGQKLFFNIIKVFCKRIWQMPLPCGSILHIRPANYQLPVAKQQTYKKRPFPGKHTLKNFVEKCQERAISRKRTNQKKQQNAAEDKRKDMVKWSQMTALRFQTGVRQQTFPASLRGGSLRVQRKEHVL